MNHRILQKAKSYVKDRSFTGEDFKELLFVTKLSNEKIQEITGFSISQIKRYSQPCYAKTNINHEVIKKILNYFHSINQ
jgi:hypothetical protein